MYYLKIDYPESFLLTPKPLTIELAKLDVKTRDELLLNISTDLTYLISDLVASGRSKLLKKDVVLPSEIFFSSALGNFILHKFKVNIAFIHYVQWAYENKGLENVKSFVNQAFSEDISPLLLHRYVEELLHLETPNDITKVEFKLESTKNSFYRTVFLLENLDSGIIESI